MTLLSETQTIITIVSSLVIIAIIHKWRRSSSLPLPPGPHLGLSIFPKPQSFLQLEKWTEQYGPVFSLRQGFKTVIVVGRVQAAIDIMEKYGAAMADRPKNTPGEVLSGGMRVVLMSNGERLRKMRRALHSHLQPKTVAGYGPVLMKKIKQHILGILDTPSNYQLHTKHFSASVVMMLTYGVTPERYDDPDIAAVNRCLRRMGDNLAGRWKIDIFPFLKYIPGYLKELQQGHAEEIAFFGTKLRQVRARLARGDVVPDCFSRYLLERQEELGLSDDELAYLSGSSMFGAGTEMTAAAITVIIMAAACHADAQRKVQEELSRVIGERAPTSADLDKLPELQAYVMETLRWRPVSANGSSFAHKTSKELFWKNYCIPKNSIVIGNVWSIAKDPEFFPEPAKFDPQRWINKDGKINQELKSFPYGFGRRVCPGQHLASFSLLLDAALLLWAFNIKEDPSSPIDSMALETSVATSPLPFKVIFEPRAAKTADGIRDILSDYAS